MNVTRSAIIGCGSYLPETIVTNADMEKRVDTTDEWITQRTGIKQRHIVKDGELTSDLGTKAAQAALQDASLTVDDIDLIIVATTTPDHTFPATATIIQHKLGMKHGAAFDVGAVCSGFVFALSTADMYLRAGQAKRILVIGAETMSSILDWEDRTTCVLFGDGAGAVVLEAREGKGDVTDQGILTSHLRSDGAHKEKLYVDGGPSLSGTAGHIKMQGREVFKHAVAMVTDVITAAYNATGYTSNDIDWFVPHQANERIIDASAKKLGIASSKVIKTVANQGNTSAASIPLALDHAVKANKIKRNDVILLEAMGGGFTWGAILVRF